jgi:DegV family protein with EDD domain
MNKNKVFTGIIAGAKEVMHHKSQLNKINVFPVADGDTGSNLYSTMQSIVKYSEEKSTLKMTLESVADAAIVGARGNSGIIMAQYFQGFSEGIHEDEVSSKAFVEASNMGFKYAYSAVETPVEGTMLTIMRVFHEALAECTLDNMEHALEVAYKHVIRAVEKTTEQLKVLKKASVVDSGARGFQMFIKGFIKGIKGEVDVEVEEDVPEIEHVHDDDFNFRYCTEALIGGFKGDIKEVLKPYGDSLIIAGNERKTRIHIHTDQPTQVFDILSEKGVLLEQKVEDMRKQYEVVHSRKYKRVIVTDSIADIPQSILDDEQVQMVNLSLLIGNESYLDKLTIDNEKVLKLASLKPTSSLPTEKQVSSLYDYLSTYYDEIIVLSVSRLLSGTFNVFKKLAEDKENIHVIDTKQNSIAQGVLVYQCIDYLKAGLETQEILNKIQLDIEASKILVKVDSIEPMIASGRLSVKMGAIVKRIGIKPIVTLNDGEGAIAGVGLSKKKALKQVIKKTIAVHKQNGFKKLALTYVDDPTEAQAFKEALEDAGIQVDYVVKSSAIIANGAGKGAVAVGYIKEN